MRASITWHPSATRRFALLLGTNEIASAIAAKLTGAGFAVVMSHDIFPPVIRRGMAFHDALFGEVREVEGVIGERADSIREVDVIHAEPHQVAVTEMHLMDIIALRSPSVIIDARMQKHRVAPDIRGVARITVGVGPQFAIGVNCDIAIETHPVATGTILSHGTTRLADGMARPLGGVGRDRFRYSDRCGIWHTPVDIGTRVYKGLQLGFLAGQPVLAPIDGTLRGIVRDGAHVPDGVKLLEIDPRGRKACWTGMDERGRAIGTGAVTAIQKLMRAAPAERRASIHV
jgi:hypothetical protein